MSTELKQAAQQAVDAFDAFGDADDFASLFELTQKMRALRAAIQQAEAQQPDTGEPVAVTSWKELERLQAGIGSIASIFPADTAGFHVQLYTRPAPSVPDVDFELQELREIERAMDDFADCGETDVVDALLLRAVQAGLLECTHFHVANRGALQEAIDAAMLAAK